MQIMMAAVATRAQPVAPPTDPPPSSGSEPQDKNRRTGVGATYGPFQDVGEGWSRVVEAVYWDDVRSCPRSFARAGHVEGFGARSGTEEGNVGWYQSRLYFIIASVFKAQAVCAQQQSFLSCPNDD